MPIGKNCQIHPTVVIGDEVTIGDGVSIGPYAVLTGSLEIGDNCWIGSSVSLGAPPEWIGKEHPLTWTERSPHQGIVIGSGTTIRELTTVHQGGERPTIIGRNCFIMNRTSVGHDVQMGDGCTVAPSTTFGGHVTMGDDVNLGINTVIHQRRVIGTRAMVGMGSIVPKDVPPYATVFGNPAKLHGTNRVGMSRSGIAEEDIAAIEAVYAAGSFGTSPAIPDSLSNAFTWWRERADKPLVV